jgi:hypothetical protein
MNSINTEEFKSKTKIFESDPKSDDPIDGISMNFIFKLLDRFLQKSIGIDLSDVNFEVSRGVQRHSDE